MPYLDTAQQWLTQSSLLLKARPATTRITSKYTISPPSSKSSTQNPDASTTTTTTTTSAPTSKPQADQPTARATLTLKTYDPESGTTLKYSTNKGAEVSRLIQILGRLARGMAGLEEKDEEMGGGEVVMKDEEAPATATTAVVKPGVQNGQGQQQQGGKGKGKKKGKK